MTTHYNMVKNVYILDTNVQSLHGPLRRNEHIPLYLNTVKILIMLQIFHSLQLL